ncbi:hypothetical protein FOBRF1_009072 [Fusarium oxysporum]
MSVYGLFRPLSGDQSPDVDLTRQLLVTLAFQLRMLRRRGVIPMLANLGTFLIAFIFSVVLAFAELGDNNTPFSLAFGLLMTWLPLLVVFTIIDRNPVSSERVRELISRWLYNVEAVKTWASEPVNDPNNIEWWQDNTEIPQALKIDVFIGQGRKIQFCGLPHALLEASATVDFHTETNLSGCAERAANRLKGWKPKAWYVVAVLSFLLVWCAIMSAFVVSFTAPTIGLGCRSLTYLLFGAFSSVSWVIQFSKRPPQWALWVSYISNTLAILTLLVVIVFQLTITPKTASLLMRAGYSDYRELKYATPNGIVEQFTSKFGIPKTSASAYRRACRRLVFLGTQDDPEEQEKICADWTNKGLAARGIWRADFDDLTGEQIAELLTGTGK